LFVKSEEDIYAFAYAQSVRIDAQNNILDCRQYSNMTVKFDPEGRVLLTFGRRPETSRVQNVAPIAPAAAAPGRPGAAGGAGRGAGARRCPEDKLWCCSRWWWSSTCRSWWSSQGEEAAEQLPAPR